MRQCVVVVVVVAAVAAVVEAVVVGLGRGEERAQAKQRQHRGGESTHRHHTTVALNGHQGATACAGAVDVGQLDEGRVPEAVQVTVGDGGGCDGQTALVGSHADAAVTGAQAHGVTGGCRGQQAHRGEKESSTTAPHPTGGKTFYKCVTQGWRAPVATHTHTHTTHRLQT